MDSISQNQNEISPYVLMLAEQERLRRERADKRTREKTDFIILSGSACSLKVQNDALVAFTGTHKGHSETMQFYRGGHNLKIIIIRGDSGNISIDALGWCKAQGVNILFLDFKGSLVQALYSENNTSDAVIRRAQYLSGRDNKSEHIAFQLIKQKVINQMDTLRLHTKLPGSQTSLLMLDELASTFDPMILADNYSNLEWLRLLEGRAASYYFSAWNGYPIRWNKASLSTIPTHWKIITPRGSGLSENRHATNPAHAILNYAYGMLESQVRLSLTAKGFDISCGFLHTDKRLRDSLVYDGMELFRAQVDHLVLEFIETTVLTRDDVESSDNGRIILSDTLLRKVIAETKLKQRHIDYCASFLYKLLVDE